MEEKNELMTMDGERAFQILQKMSVEEQAKMLMSFQEFTTLLMQYRCAIREVETKLNVLYEEFSMLHERNPFDSIKSRVKEPTSILEKMQRKGYEVSVENIETKLNDVAGVRVICSFADDIYYLADMLSRQDDLTVIQKKDYIKNPKENGYRSLHLIIQIPIFLSDQKKQMRVEVQFRTIAMDFWASLDHKLKYKKNLKNSEMITRELKQCADIIGGVDVRMQEIRNLIEDGEDEE